MTDTLICGTTFARTAPSGDIEAGTGQGVVVADRRVLSQLRLLVDGAPPAELAHAAHGTHVEQHAAARAGEIALARTWTIGAGAAWHQVEVVNEGAGEQDVTVELELDADGLDTFVVKALAERARGDESRAEPLEAELGVGGAQPERPAPPLLSPAPDAGSDPWRPRWSLRLGAGSSAVLLVEAGDTAQQAGASSGSAGGLAQQPAATAGAARRGGIAVETVADRHAAARERGVRELAEWREAAPTLTGGAADLATTWARTVDDLHALGIDMPDGQVPAAGVPWYLTLFGRDSLLTCLFALPLGTARAAATLRALARLQATTTDDEVDAEPGKVLHELRTGAAAERWHAVYYGTVDATPLWLVLLEATCTWAGSDDLAHELREPALRALAWLRERADHDGDGLVDFERRSSRGLLVQSWKDSHDSQRFRDGRVTEAMPIAPLEAQGYAVAALRAVARLASRAWADEALARELACEADDLVARVDAAFVVHDESLPEGDPRVGGWHAQGIDGDGRPIDSLCSNPGHLLWSDAVPAGRVARLAAQLTHPALRCGWGVRTMSTLDGGYDAQSYHCGSSWPHDSAICTAGLLDRGAHDAGHLLARDLFDAAAAGGGRLPELVAGTQRAGHAAPVAYPTSCVPQAWSAAAPVLLLTSLLGLAPDAAAGELRCDGRPLPAWLDGLEWSGLHALGRRWTVTVTDGAANVRELERVSALR